MQRGAADCAPVLRRGPYPELELLSHVERHILKMIAEDWTSKEIAEALEISLHTVENHRAHICAKLNLRGSHSLLKFAFDHKAAL